MSFVASRYQQGIFDWVEHGEGNAGVDAVAGSGKTTTAVKSAKLMKGSGLFVAFSKAISLELAERLKGTSMEAKTVHSLGYGITIRALGVKKLDVKDNKYYRHCRALIEEEIGTEDVPRVNDQTKDLNQIVDLLRVNLMDHVSRPMHDLSESITEICDQFAIEEEHYYEHMAREALDAGIKAAQTFGTVDFTDMIWLPCILDNVIFPSYDWVVVDEAQDINNAQRRFILECVNPFTGRLMYIGDPYQAIFGFAGANAQAFSALGEETNAIQLPLSVCYRCPTSHLDLAREIVPHIEAAPGAKEGLISEFADVDLFKEVRPGDLILGRKTAPLIKGCIGLLRERVRAKVKGRDIGKTLFGLAKKIMRFANDNGGFNWLTFGSHMYEYRLHELAGMQAKQKSDAVIDGFVDRIECLEAIYDEYESRDLTHFGACIDELFSDTQATIYFSTAHRAKGLENPRVLLLAPEEFPLTWKGQLPWQREQEFNLKYVALTRAKEELVFINTTKKD